MFRQLFETLVRLDCTGNVRPGLAVAWSADPDHRAWNFTLRDSGAAGIVSSWQERPAVATALGIETVSAEGDGRLRVTMRDPLDSVPRVFADPALALRRQPVPGALEFRVEHTDARDALDRGGDILVTRDPTLVEYAASKPDVVTFPLPWSRTYVLLRTVPGDPIPRSAIGEAVRADARPAEPPFWWEGRGTCDEPQVPAARAPSQRVVYVRGDEVARGLAERIVALGSSGAGLRTAALMPTEFRASLSSGVERAYVIAVPRTSFAPCRDSGRWPTGATVLPLIDTRAHAIIRRGTPDVSVDWDGTVRLQDEAERAAEPR